MSRKRPAAPPRSRRAARDVIHDELAWIFGLASDDVGGDTPYKIEPRRECIEDVRQAVTAALLDMPQRKLIALGRKLHELAESLDFQIDQLTRDHEGRS